MPNFPISGVLIPNIADDKGTYYISYNSIDRLTYGDATTAIVVGQGLHFFVLNGNHYKALRALPTLEACIAYFKAHSDLVNKYSENVDHFTFTDNACRERVVADTTHAEAYARHVGGAEA